MSVDINKPADQVFYDAKMDLETAFAAQDDKSAAGDQLQAALNDPEVRKKADEDVKQLAKTIRDIRQGFVNVATKLVEFDKAEFKDKSGNVLKLGPEWAPLIQEFDKTLHNSLKQATDAVDIMKSVNSVLGDVAPGDAKDLKIELTNFMTRLRKEEDKALATKNDFQKLSDSVKTFVGNIDAALEKATEALKADLQAANDALKKLQGQLDDINNKIKSLGIATISTLATGAAAAGAAIFTLNPAAIATAVGSIISGIGTGIALIKALHDRSNILDEIEGAKRKIADINARIELLKKYKTDLDNTKVIVVDVSSQINVIANIWQTITLDMHQLSEDLDANIGADAQITKFFLKKLGVAKDIYKHLIYILETYVEQTNSVHEPSS